MNEGLINRILPFSSVDGPGNRTVIFLQGCNFNCLYCHNPETIKRCNSCGRCVEYCPYNALSYKDNKVIWNKHMCKHCDKCIEACKSNSLPRAVNMTVDEVMKEIIKVKPFISGITVSGGECTLQSDFVTELFKRVKEIGLTTFLDTNGGILLYEENKLIKYMDMAMFDLKSYETEEHKFLTGMDNGIVIKNIKYLSRLNKLYEIRTVIVPEVLNNYNNVDMISKLIAKLNPKIRYKLIKYRPMGVRTELFHSYQPSDEMMKELYNLAVKNGCSSVVLV